MFERFTDRARRSMVLAQAEARRLRHNFIGTEHLLLGLLAEEDGLAAKALNSVGVTLEATRQTVAEMVGPATETVASPPFTPRSKKVLEEALREALQLGQNYIGTEHILLGLLRQGDGVGAQAIGQLGVELSQVRRAVIEMLSAPEFGQITAAGMVGPYCPYCGAPLAKTARAKRLSIPIDDEDGHADVVLVYCEGCGRTTGLGTAQT